MLAITPPPHAANPDWRKTMSNSMSLKDVAQILGVKAYRIEYLLATALCPNRRCGFRADVFSMLRTWPI